MRFSLRFHCRIPLLRLRYASDVVGKYAAKEVFIMEKLKDVKILSVAAMLAGLAIVLGFFSIPVSNLIEIRFKMLPIALAGYLFGPGIGAAVGMIADLGAYLVKPTGAFFPGFTATTALAGFLFGLFLHQKKFTLPRLIITEAVYTLVCSILLNSLWLAILYHMNYIASVISRIPSSLAMLPVNALMLYAVITPVKQFRVAEQFSLN